VINGKYFPSGTSLILHKRQDRGLPGSQGRRRIPADFVIDCRKSVIPGLQHSLSLAILGKGSFRRKGRSPRISAIAGAGDECAWTRSVRSAGEPGLDGRNIRGEVPGPRIHQAIHVGPFGVRYARGTLMSRFSFIAWYAMINYAEKRSGGHAFRAKAPPRST